jgi:hypothetical protein
VLLLAAPTNVWPGLFLSVRDLGNTPQPKHCRGLSHLRSAAHLEPQPFALARLAIAALQCLRTAAETPPLPAALDRRRDGRLLHPPDRRRPIIALRSEERSGCRAEAPCHGSQHSRDPQATGQTGDKSEAATRHGHQQPRCEQLQACRHTATHRKTESETRPGASPPTSPSCRSCLRPG